MTNTDEYTWIGGSGGTWDDPGNWEDVTTGQVPAASPPGITNTATIEGSSDSTYEIIDGVGSAANLTADGLIDFAGTFTAPVLNLGTSGIESGLFLAPQSTLSTTSVAIGTGTLTASGAGTWLSAAGSIVVGVATAEQVQLGGLDIEAGATLTAAGPVSVAAGTLTVNGTGAGAAIGDLDIGTAGSTEGGFPLAELSILTVTAGATLAVAGSVDAVDGLITVAGTGASLTATGSVILGDYVPTFFGSNNSNFQVTGGASAAIGGLLLEATPASAFSGELIIPSLYVDTASRLEVGTAGTGAVGVITVDDGAGIVATTDAVLTGSISNDGVISETGGTLTIASTGDIYGGFLGGLSGDGTIVLGTSAALLLDAAVAAGQTIVFAGSADALAIGAAGTYNFATGTTFYAAFQVGATIDGFATGNAISFAGVSADSVTYTATGADIGTLALFDGTAEVASLTLLGDYTGRSFAPVPTTSNGSAVVLLAPGGTGSFPVDTGTDSYDWIGSSGGAWTDAGNWADATTGASPAGAVPGIANSVTITGPAGPFYELIGGGGGAASLTVDGYVDLTGRYGAGTIDLGGDGTASGLFVPAHSTLSAGTVAIGSGILTASGAGASLLLDSAGTMIVGSAGAAMPEGGRLVIAAGATLAAPGSLIVPNGIVSVDGTASEASLAQDLVLGTVAAADGSTVSALGSLSVTGGATLTVTGAIDAVDGAILVSGTGASLAATGPITLGDFSGYSYLSGSNLQVLSGGAVQTPGLTIAATQVATTSQQETPGVYVDLTSRLEIGTAGTGAVGALTVDDGAGIVATTDAALTGSVVNDGLISETGGTLTITSIEDVFGRFTTGLSGHGTIALGTGAALDLNASAEAGQTILFADSTDVLAIGAAGSYSFDAQTTIYTTYQVAATIDGFATGNIISFAAVVADSVTYTATGADIGTLALFDGTAEVASLTLLGDYTGRSFAPVPTTGNGSAVILLAPGSAGSFPVDTGTDSYDWIGSSGGAWTDAANWADATTGASPATAVPGIANSVTITGPAGPVYEIIGGGGAAASLTVDGFVDLTGTYTAGTVDLGADGTASGLFVAAHATLSATTVTVGAGVLTASGTGAGLALAAAGTATIGTATASTPEGGGLAVADGATLAALGSLVVVNGTLSVDGAASQASLANGLVLGTVASAGGGTVSALGSVAVTGGATLAVTGAIDAVDGHILVSGAGASLVDSGTVTLGDFQSYVYGGDANLRLNSGGGATLAGLVFAATPVSVFADEQADPSVSVDATATLLIGAGDTAVTGAIVVSPGAAITATTDAALLGSLVNDGQISETGGTLTIGSSGDAFFGFSGGLSGSGTITLGDTAALTVQTSIAAGQTILLAGEDDTLTIGAAAATDFNTGATLYTPYAMAGTLAGFDAGDQLIFGHDSLTAVAFQYDGDGFGTLDLLAGTVSVGSVTLAGDYTGRSFAVTPATFGSSVVTVAAQLGTKGPHSETVLAGITTALQGFSVIDPNDGATVTVELRSTVGLLSLSAGGGTVSGSGSNAVTVSGSLAQVNAALATLSYTAGTAGSDTIQITTHDSAGSVASQANVAVAVLAVAPPGITVPDSVVVELGVTEPVPAMAIAYPDGAVAGEQVTVTLTDSVGVLSLDGSTGGTITGAGSGTLSIAGSLRQVNAGLATLTYATGTAGSDTISVTAAGTHGGAATPAAFPVATSGTPFIHTPVDVSVFRDGADAVSDVFVDEAPVSDAEIFTITVTDATGLLAAAGGAVTGSGSTSLTITGSLGQVNQALASLSDSFTAAGTDSIVLQASDSFGGIATPETIAVTAITLTPVLEGPAGFAVDENATTGISGLALVEAGALPGATFTVTLQDTTGTLSASGAGVSGAGSTQLTITGPLDAVNAALDTLTDIGGNAPNDTITLGAFDGFGDRAAGLSVAVQNLDFVPHFTGPDALTVGQGVVTPVPFVSLTQPGNVIGELYTITLGAGAGVLTDSGANVAGVSGSGTGTLTIAGTLAQVNADLAALAYEDAGTGTDAIVISGTTSSGAVPQSGTIAITSVVENAATVALLVSGAPITVDGSIAFLDLGSVLQDGTDLTAAVAVANLATGFADVLIGGLEITAGRGFATTGSGSFANIHAGQTVAVDTLSLSAATPGTFTETFVLDSEGENAAGPTGIQPGQTLTVTGTVTPRPAPDLVVTGISAPTQINLGDQALVIWTVQNQGDAIASGPWEDQVFLASDPAGSNLELVGTLTYDGALAPGQTLTLSTLISAPGSLAGDEYVMVKTDVTGATDPHPGELHQGVAPTPTALIQPLTALAKLPAGAVIDWAGEKAAVQPPFVDDTDWNLVWDRFVTEVGTTAGSITAALADAAATLRTAGEPTSDTAALFEYVLANASGGLPAGPLTQATDFDATSSLVGLSLVRVYDADLLNRNNAGAFGDGWSFTYGVSLTTDAAGTVFITASDGTVGFSSNGDGTYTAQPGSNLTLTQQNGTYQLDRPDGTVDRFGANGSLTSITDASGNTATVSYGGNGVISGVAGSDGESLTFTTNAAGRITQATDAAGRTVTYTYDASGTHLLSAASALSTVTYSYDPGTNAFAANALTGITDQDGRTTTYTYDAQGNVSQVLDGAGNTQLSLAYPSPGTVTQTDAAGNTTTFVYDTEGDVAALTDPAGNTTQLSWQPGGGLTGVVSPDGEHTSYQLDADGNITATTDANGNTTTATYAPGTNQLTGLTDANGNTTSYSYDAVGNLTQIAYADGSATTLTYTSSGLVASQTDGNDITSTETYDALGELTRQSFSDGTSESFTYDPTGALTAATAIDGGTTSFTYDSAGRLTSVTNAAGQVETYAYNAAGQEISRTEPDGTVTQYSYNAAGELAAVEDGAGNALVSYAYDSLGRVITATAGNGQVTSTTYDADNNIADITITGADGTVVSRQTTTFNADDRPVTMITSDGTWSYGYDPTGQLTSAVFTSTNASIPNQSLSYAYDAAGNRTSTVINGAQNDYASNNLDQYTASDGTSYRYDSDGQLVAKIDSTGTTTYSYNVLGELTAVDGPAGSDSYTYDALGNRIGATHDGTVSTYVIDPLSLSTQTTGPLSAVAQIDDASGQATATYAYGADGLAAEIGSAGVAYYNADANGNILSLTGADGTVLDSYVYDPFGTTLSTTGSTDNPYQYSGALGVSTTTSGLISMHARVYDPVTGRFLSRDPIGIDGGANPYAYALNNPLLEVDPSGYWGGGFVSTVSSEAGAGRGGAISLSGGGAAFVDSTNGHVSHTNFASYGHFVSGQNNDKKNWVVGASGGVTAGGFITNANDKNELAGPFDNLNVNLPFMSVQVGVGSGKGGRTVWQVAVSAGPKVSAGLSLSRYTTYTIVNPDNPVQASPGTNASSAGALGCPHFTSFSGQRFDFQGAGEFVAVRSTQPGNLFQVQIRVEPEGSIDSGVSIISQIAVKVGAHTVTFGADRADDNGFDGTNPVGSPGEADVVWVDGAPVTMDGAHSVLALPDGTVTFISQNDYRVTLATGETVDIAPYGDGMGFNVALGADDGPGSVEGFLGPDNGAANDFQLPDGTVLQPPLTDDQLYQTFAGAWRVTDATSLLDYKTGQTTATFTDTQYPRVILTLADFPSDVVAAAMAVVSAYGITDPVLAGDAAFDYITMGDPNFIADDAGVAGLSPHAIATSTPVVITHSVTPAPSIGILPATPAQTEPRTGDTQATFLINLTNSTTLDTVVNYTLLPGVGLPDGKTYFTAADFGGAFPSGSVTIAAGQVDAPVTFDVPAAALGAAPDKWLMATIDATGASPVYDPTGQTDIINGQPTPGTPAAPEIKLLSAGATAAGIENAASLTEIGSDTTLDLGEVLVGVVMPDYQIGIANTAPLAADDLSSEIGTVAGTGFKISGTQPPDAIAAGSAFQDLYVTGTATAAGPHSTVITVHADDTNLTGYLAPLADMTLTVMETLVEPALMAVDSTPIAFPAVRVGANDSQTITVGNAAIAPAAALDVMPVAGDGAVASGAIAQLAPGASDATSLVIGLVTDTAGTLTASVVLDPLSDLGNGATVPLAPTQTLTLTGQVFATATASLAVTTLDLGIVHVGDTLVAAVPVANLAEGGLTDSLIGNFTGLAMGVTAGPDLAVAAGDSGALSLAFDTGTAGVLTGAAALALASHDAVLTDAPLTVPALLYTGTIDAFATADLVALSGPGTLTQDGTALSLDLGTLLIGSDTATIALGVGNAASGQADLLVGSFDLAGDPEFTAAGFAGLDGIAAGESLAAGSLMLATDHAGHFTEQVTLDGVSTNASGFQSLLEPEVLTITADVACYLAGTRILTTEGEIAVEALRIGDRVVTASGQARPIRWIGQRAYDRRFVARRPGTMPIRIRAGAIADGVPRRDLYVSPKHAMMLDDVLIPAELLVNGCTIAPATDTGVVRYFHIELESHDILLAEGALSESFIDCDSRLMFQNAADYAALYPDEPPTRWAMCAKRVEGGAALEVVRRRLAQRAGLAGCHAADAAEPGQPDGRIDRADHREVSGWAFDGARPHTRLEVEILVDDVVVGVTVANAFRPDIAAAGLGDGRCAFVWRFSPALPFDAAHRIGVRLPSAAWCEAGLMEATLAAPGPVTLPKPRPTGTTAPGRLDGRIDVCNAEALGGWAYDHAWPDRPVELEFVCDMVVIGTAVAALYRPDLAAAGLGAGRCAFRFAPPTPIRGGSPVVVRRAGGGAILGYGIIPLPAATRVVADAGSAPARVSSRRGRRKRAAA